MGPFTPELVSACIKANGGNSCQLNLWNARFLYKLMQPEMASKKPPQFVMLAFDGSRSLDAWNKSRNFAKEGDGAVAAQDSTVVAGADIAGEGIVFGDKNKVETNRRMIQSPIQAPENDTFVKYDIKINTGENIKIADQNN